MSTTLKVCSIYLFALKKTFNLKRLFKLNSPQLGHIQF